MLKTLVFILVFFQTMLLNAQKDSMYSSNNIVVDAFGPATYFSISYEYKLYREILEFDFGFGLGYAGSFSSKLGPNYLYFIPYINIALNKKLSPFLSFCYIPYVDPIAASNKLGYECPGHVCDTWQFNYFSSRAGVEFKLDKFFIRPYYCNFLSLKFKTYHSWFGISLGLHY